MKTSRVSASSSKLVKSPWRPDGSPPITKLATCDQTSCAIATSRATFWKAKLDVEYLEKCLGLVLEDLPFLGGRIQPVKFPIGWKMADLQIANTNEGLEFIVVSAEDSTLADFGPNTWPMKGVTVSDPQTPLYIPRMDTAKKMLTGKEPLCKVQLTLLADGCILGITVSHMITDGMHWPALMEHIAARYREVATGAPAQPQHLIEAGGNRGGLSLETMKTALSGGSTWKPAEFTVHPSFGDYFRAGGLLWGNAAARIQLDIIFLPRDRLAKLKNAVLEGIKDGTPVTTGDVVQALAAMAVHAGEGKSLLPVLPKVMVSLVQIPSVSKGHFGNAVHPLTVGIPSEEVALVKEGDFLATLRTLARQIRLASNEVRSNPAKALQAIYESSQVCDAPVHKSLAYLAGQRLPYVTCTTNYIGTLPGDASLDFGLGVSQLGYRSQTYPLAKSMAVMRPSMPPYGEGLFMSLNMSASQAKKLRGHAMLQALIPDAIYLG